MARARTTPEMMIHGVPWRRHNERGEKLLTVAELFDASANRGKGKKVPMIRLRGGWLEELGFRSGERVVVTIDGARIVLTVEGQE